MLVVEVPYTITMAEEWQRCAQRAKKDETCQQYEAFAFLATHLQRWLSNGFVVFREDYPRLVERAVLEWLQAGRHGTVAWDALLRQIRAWASAR